MDRRLSATDGAQANSFWRNLWRFFPLGLLVFILFVLLGAALLWFQTEEYRSEAKLLALPGDSYSVRDDPQSTSVSENFRPEAVMNVEMQLLLSRDLGLATLRRVGNKKPSGVALERDIDAFRSKLRVLPVPEANVIELSFAGESPKKSQEMLNQVLKSYFDARQAVLRSDRLDPLVAQRDEAREELRSTNLALVSFRGQNNITDFELQTQSEVNNNSDLRQQLASTRASLSSARSALGRLRSLSANVPKEVEIFRDDTEVQRSLGVINAEILRLEARRTDLAKRYLPGSPLIQEVDRQIAGLRSAATSPGQVAKQSRRFGRNTDFDTATGRLRETEANASGLAAQVNQLIRELTASEQRLASLNRVAAEVADLTIQKDIADQRYRILATQVEEEQARTTGSSLTNVRVIQQPTLPFKKATSSRLLLAGSSFTGLVLGSAMVLGLAIMRRDEPEVAIERAQSEKTAFAKTVPDSEAALDKAKAMGMDILASLEADEQSPLDPSHLPNHLSRFADNESKTNRGQVVAFLAATSEPYVTALNKLIDAFRDDGRTAIIRFEAPSYFGRFESNDPVNLIPGERSMFVGGSTAWLGRTDTSATLEKIRKQYDWVLLFLPPAGDEDGFTQSGLQMQYSSANADFQLMLVDHSAPAITRVNALTKELVEAGIRPQGAVLTRKNRTKPF